MPSASAIKTTTWLDGAKAQVILTALVTPVEVMESQAMQDLLWRVCFRRTLRPHHVNGDAKYGTIEDIVAVMETAPLAHKNDAGPVPGVLIQQLA